MARQTEIDKSIAAKAEFEYLYDKPYDDKKKVRVAGPFTVESLSPHRMLGVDENDELINTVREDSPEYGSKQSFPQMILDNLKTAGVQQAHKEDRITFTALTPWPGQLVCAEGRYMGRRDTGIVLVMAHLTVEQVFETALTDEEHGRLGERLDKCLDAYGARWVRSYLSTDRRRMVCVFEAPDAEAVRTSYRSAGVGFERVWPADVYSRDAAV